MSDRALIVVPTYNERDNVAQVVERFLAAAPEAELLFVDDASPDGTGALLDELAAANPRVHVLHRAGKLGLGTAYLDGFAWGLGEGFDDEDPRSDRVPREVAAEEIQIRSKRPTGMGAHPWIERDDLVDEQEGLPMGKQVCRVWDIHAERAALRPGQWRVVRQRWSIVSHPPDRCPSDARRMCDTSGECR